MPDTYIKPQKAAIVWSLAVVATILVCKPVGGQDYPNKVIRILTSPGGGNDLVARSLSQGLSAAMKQSVIVDNRVLIIAVETVAKAPADGYTLLITGVSSFCLGPLMRRESYDPIRDFSPVILTLSAPNVLVVHPSLPVRSVKELIALAKARPGALDYATGASGSSNHLAAELFKSMANVNMVRISYKGIGPALADVIAGNVQIIMPNTSSVTGHLKAGRLKALAVASARPSLLAPGLPTVAASGLPGYESTASTGFLAPASTPPTIILRLNREAARILTEPSVKERLFISGAEVVAGSSEEFAAGMKAEMTRMGKVIKEAGIREE